jgi:hypothetical protein
MRTTGTVSAKRYGCSHCGNVELVSTNHWGEIYSRCDSCSWRRPLEATVQVCLEPLPLGYAEPEPWTGDVATIVG